MSHPAISYTMYLQQYLFTRGVGLPIFCSLVLQFYIFLATFQAEPTFVPDEETEKKQSVSFELEIIRKEF